jgi:hypothetical protein
VRVETHVRTISRPAARLQRAAAGGDHTGGGFGRRCDSGDSGPAVRAPEGGQSGTTAVTSISTFAPSSTKPATWIAVIAGKAFPITSR